MAIDYKSAGVDVKAGYEAVSLMKKHVSKTFNENVLTGLGSFGGAYVLPKGYGEPVLISGTDGVGTKLKIAFAMDKHDTVGIDCVAMCVNDIVCQGAMPMFFLDYMACGKLYPKVAEQIVKGVSDGCVESGCALVGGETAEMPGFYPDGEYDLAGFAVGIVDKSKVITGEKVSDGDVIIGLASTGVHSNGFSLVRKVIGDDAKSLSEYSDELGMTFGEALLTPTKLYVKDVMNTLAKVDVSGIAHITGGGFIENVPRMLNKNVKANIDLSAVDRLPIFDIIKAKAGVDDTSMYNTFNMGIGMMMCVNKDDAELACQLSGGKVIGEITKGDGDVELK